MQSDNDIRSGEGRSDNSAILCYAAALFLGFTGIVLLIACTDTEGAFGTWWWWLLKLAGIGCVAAAFGLNKKFEAEWEKRRKR